ncbi:MAG: hypothetical protein ABIH46_00465 [Chloroflexota bacterium]
MEGLAQIGSHSFLDEGVDRVIEVTREQAALSGLVIFTYTWSKALAYRSSLPTEGRTRGPDHEFHGGAYFRPHGQYYRNTSIEAERLRTADAPFKDVDILERVLSPCHEAGLRVYAALPLGREPEYLHELAPGFLKCSEIDAWGRPVGEALPHGWQERAFLPHCYNNPEYRAFYRGLVEDQLKSYPLDGFLILPDERYGPMEKALITGIPPTCFCPYCIEKAKAGGIDAEAAQAGLRELYELATQARDDKYQRPAKGHMSQLLALLLRYPEILAWERLWYETVEEFLHDLYTTAKRVRQECRMGIHVWQVASWALIARAETRYEKLGDCADWIKPVLYDKPGGVRLLKTYAEACHRTILRDLEFEESVRFLLCVMGQPVPASSEVLAREGLGPEYVERETARALQAVQGKAQVYPGLGIDVEPNAGLQYPEQLPEDVEAAVAASARAGAGGFVLSINYAQMRDQSLRAVGRAVRALESGG